MTGNSFLFVMGTRPEVIKLAPVYFALQSVRAEVKIVSTNQQVDLLRQALNVFGLYPDYSLSPGGDLLVEQMARMAIHLPDVYQQANPDYVIVQGDTTSAMAGALAAYYNQRKLAYVEAGLFTGNNKSPFPEEGHRRMIAQIADINFTPTEYTKTNLQEIGATNYFVTGNPVVDTLRMVKPLKAPISKSYVLITIHRRESFGEPLLGMLAAVKILAHKYPDIKFVYALHSNPHVADMARVMFTDSDVQLLQPQNYPAWLGWMQGALFIMTDSGGIQEEAPSFKVPVLVLRNTTERQEAVNAGCAWLVGNDGEKIVWAASRLIDNPGLAKTMKVNKNPFGDGYAAERIAGLLTGAKADVTYERVFATV